MLLHSGAHSHVTHMLHGAGIFTYIWAIFGVNAGKYSIHGAYGLCLLVYNPIEV